MQKKIFLLVFSFVVFGGSFYIGSEGVSAQQQYTLLEQIPGFPSWSGYLPTYLQNLYKFTFWAIGIAAMLMLTIGGFLYATSAGNTSRMGTAKTIIFDSLLGICLALVAWLFLYVINPDFTTMKLPGITVTPTGPIAPSTTPGTPLPTTPPPTAPPATPGSVRELANQVLANPAINKAGAAPFCRNSAGSVTPQSNLQELSSTEMMSRCQKGCDANNFCAGATSINPQILQAMLAVAKIMPFTITSMAGGSHSATSLHYSGRAIDVAPATQALVDAFRANGLGGSRCETNAGVTVPCGAGATHIHAQ